MSNEMVHKIASHDIIAINEESTMEQAAELMRNKKIRHLPVTNTRGNIVGILSDRDIRNKHSAVESQLVKHHMNYPVLEANVSDPIGSVVKRMLSSKISCLLLVDEYTAPCGIVTTDDMLKYLSDLIENNGEQLNTSVGNVFKFLKFPTFE